MGSRLPPAWQQSAVPEAGLRWPVVLAWLLLYHLALAVAVAMVLAVARGLGWWWLTAEGVRRILGEGRQNAGLWGLVVLVVLAQVGGGRGLGEGRGAVRWIGWW
jgi:hypothetical protein